MGIISQLLWTPVLGVIILAFTQPGNTRAIRTMALLVSAATLLLSCLLLARFDASNATPQLLETDFLFLGVGTSYTLGIDGISLPMVVLAALLTLVALLASGSITNGIKSYHISVLILEFGMMGVFLAQQWSLFFIFWEITLVPLYFLIDRWGGQRRHAASLNFVLYTMGGSIFMLLSIFAIEQFIPADSNTLMANMRISSEDIPVRQQLWILAGFLLGLGVKMPIFPLHGWLPLAHVEAPSPVSILLSGILLKMGAYGLIRIIATLPEAAVFIQPFLLTLALIGMIYGALLAWRQTDLKAMIAYASVSHMGIVLLGIAALNENGFTGAVVQMTAHGLIAGALFLLVGLLYERTHTRDIKHYSSLVQVMPRFTLFMTLSLLAAMGLPGTVGFIAELHTMIGGFQQWNWLMVFFSISILITASYALRTIAMLFTGPVKSDMKQIEDLRLSEMFAAGVLVLLIVALGITPAPLIHLSASAITYIDQSFAGVF
ncbi:MAG: NADH-quinone oxidoreductase subunit M [Gammaproteobacteria bacterium]|jgi:NADH-quinone oxidoreductase subunit M|nr:NADH-quinone oxidoreductase subunit M [Gammaproteobacteria bacterium]